jgi:hypothetical protein
MKSQHYDCGQPDLTPMPSCDIEQKINHPEACNQKPDTRAAHFTEE